MKRFGLILLGIGCVLVTVLASFSSAMKPILTVNDVGEPYEDEMPETKMSSAFYSQLAMSLNNLYGGYNEEYTKKIEEWKQVNPDVIGYIDIPDFEISYPVLQGEDNKTYLRTNINGEYDVAGAIFLDANYKDIYSPVKLIHGHNMRNGSMFHKLPQMLKWDTLDNAPRIFYTDALGTKEFQIFAIFSVNSEEESIIVSQYSTAEEVKEYKELYVERSWVPASVVPESTELLMLNTCWYGESGHEHFLHCVVVAARVGMAVE